MTVATTDSVAGPFNGNDVATAFPFSNVKILQNSDLTVYLTDTAGAETLLTEGVDYSLALNADQDSAPGGTITYPLSGSPLATGEKLTGKRDMTQTQLMDLSNQSKYDAEVVEVSSDKAMMIMQGFQEELDRSVKVGLSSGIDPDDLISSIETSESNAAASASAASTSEGNAAASEVAADNSATYSEEWATKAEDSLVSAAAGGDEVDDYSALHHAAKAAASASTSADLASAVSGTNTYTATLGISAYVSGKTYYLSFTNTNTVVAPTLNLDSKGAKTIKNLDGSALAIGAMPDEAFVRDDGTDMILLNPAIAGLNNLDVSQWGGEHILLLHSETAGTNGGTFTSGAWQTRTLNSESIDTGNNCSLSSNQFTLDAGTYIISAKAIACFVDAHKARIRNITDGATEINGLNCGTVTETDPDSVTTAMVDGVIIIAASKTFELQHRCGTTRTSTGFGRQSGWGEEIYASIKIRKVK